jgi:quinol monooxygenase YgiN
MIVLRFKVQCQPEKAAMVADAMSQVVLASRPLPGVVHFDVAQDLTDPNALIATEVFEDRAARELQEALPEVGKVMGMLPTALAGAPEATLYTVSAAEPATDHDPVNPAPMCRPVPAGSCPGRSAAARQNRPATAVLTSRLSPANGANVVG